MWVDTAFPAGARIFSRKSIVAFQRYLSSLAFSACVSPPSLWLPMTSMRLPSPNRDSNRNDFSLLATGQCVLLPRKIGLCSILDIVLVRCDVPCSEIAPLHSRIKLISIEKYTSEASEVGIPLLLAPPRPPAVLSWNELLQVVAVCVKEVILFAYGLGVRAGHGFLIALEAPLSVGPVRSFFICQSRFRPGHMTFASLPLRRPARFVFLLLLLRFPDRSCLFWCPFSPAIE
ncbi:hypothetical protein KC320_g131 [Hortaea werneckii]|nr:hypothetical protein KC320_g131 [Hortaea werneckii]